MSAVSFVGGLIGGYTTGAVQVSFTTCSASGDVTGSSGNNGASTGGFLGSGQTAIYTECFATGNVSGRTNVGGFIGDTGLIAQFVGCYARGNVSGKGVSVAGFVGSASGANFSRCFCTGPQQVMLVDS